MTDHSDALYLAHISEASTLIEQSVARRGREALALDADLRDATIYRLQTRLVEHAGGLLVREELAGIKGEPLAVLGAHLVRDEQVGVQVRVRGARGPVHEARGEEAVGVDLQEPAVAAAGEGGVVLQERERSCDGGLVARPHR